MDEILKHITSHKLIMLIAIAIIIYFFIRVLYMGEKNIIEGLQSNGTSTIEQLENLQKHITTTDKTLNELLLVDKYKSNYENIIISLDEMIDKKLLYTVVNELENKNKSDPTDTLTDEFVTKVNNMITFKTNLNSIMDSLDKS